MFNRRVEESGHKFIQVVAAWALVPTAFLLALSLFASAADIPSVYKDSSTRECIAVVTAQGVVKPCEGNVPIRHHEILSAPGQTYEQIVAARNR